MSGMMDGSDAYLDGFVDGEIPSVVRIEYSVGVGGSGAD